MKDLHKLSNSWQTPDWLFKELNEEFNFDIDLCATKENSKCELFFVDYLINELGYRDLADSGTTIHQTILNNKVCFMNPPYSNPKPFIEKAWEDSRFCKIVCLVECDPSTKWWATFWNYENVFMPNLDKDFQDKYKLYEEVIGPKPGCEVRFFPKRIKFDPPQQLIDSGEVWKVKNKWGCKCRACAGTNYVWSEYTGSCDCEDCRGKGYRELSGPTFPSALLIFDRRGL